MELSWTAKKLAASSQPVRQIYDWGNLNAEDYYETPWQEKVPNPLDPPLFYKKGSHLWKWKHIHWYTFSKDLRISLRRPCKNLWVGPCSHILWGHWKIDLESCVTIHWNYLGKTCGETFVKIYWEDTVTDIVFGEPSQNILKQPCKTFRADPCQNICWPPCTNISQKLCHNISSRPWENLWGDRCQNILGRHCDDRTHFPRARKWGQIIQSVQRAQLSKSLFLQKPKFFNFRSERCLSIFNERVESCSRNVFGCSINGDNISFTHWTPPCF